MRSRIALATLALVGLWAATLAVKAQVVATQPGVMTEARVWIQNRGQGEAVPVAIEQAGTLTVRLAGPATLALAADSLMRAQLVRQAWEYQTVRIAADQDPAPTLTASGQQGWEVVGILDTGPAGRTYLMKRPG